MRSEVDAKTFVQALDKVSDLIRKSSIPALNGVLVQFGPDSCTLTSTNLESYLSIKVPAQGDSFSCLLDHPKETARAFRQFEDELVLEQTETGEDTRRKIRVAFCCGPRSAALPAFLPEDFPERPNWEAKHTFTANAASLHTRVSRVWYATAPPSLDESRACVYAVDGYRMAWAVDDVLSVPTPFMASPAALDQGPCHWPMERVAAILAATSPTRPST